MPEEPPQSAVAPRAVFLSYAKEDVAATQRICASLQAAGVEVWLDQSELTGGDAWDRKIREQLKTCALFAPVISASTQARREGYFRLEWKLAAQRTHTIADGTPFLLPIVIDGTRDADALVPEEFRAVQWTRLPAGETSAAFCARVKKLLGGFEMETGRPRPVERGSDFAKASTDTEGAASPASQPAPSPTVGRRVPAAAWVGAIAVVAIGAGATFFATRKSESASPNAGAGTRPPTAEISAPSPSRPPAANEKSLAVLPFANLSADKENEFFTDGMHDELLTALAKIGTLKVISRTSVLAYRDPAKRNLKQIAAELGVAHVLEGSVSRSGGSVRINVKLIDAATDQQRWAETFNLRTVTDVFQVQADISAQIAQALAATISPELKLALAQKLTANPAAYDLYLRARRWREMGRQKFKNTAKFEELVVAPLEQAVALDPKFAAAYAELSQVHAELYWWPEFDPTPARLAKAKAAVDTALLIDPALPVAHLALGNFHYRGSLDYARATEEFAIALAGMPGDADVLLNFAVVQRRQGKWAEATVNCERALAINPRNRSIPGNWVACLLAQRYYVRAEQAAERALAIFPADDGLLRQKAQARFARDGDRARYRSALDAIPTVPDAEPPDPLIRQFEVAMENGRHAEAVKIYAGAAELFARAGQSNDSNLRRYFFAATAVGEREKVRARALAALVETTATATVQRGEGQRDARMALYHAYAGQPEEARRLADRALELMPVKRDAALGPLALGDFAQVHLALGDRDRALALLDQALSVPSGLIANLLRLEPWWAPLRDDPRFKAALAKAAPRD